MACDDTPGGMTAAEYLAKVEADPKRAAALQRGRERLAHLHVRTRHPQDYVLHNEQDGTRWRGTADGRWVRDDAGVALPDGWRKCEFCGCNTNAALRACCDKGREADRAAGVLAVDVRQQFEAWATDNGYPIERTSDGYTDMRTSCAWRGWHAHARGVMVDAEPKESDRG